MSDIIDFERAEEFDTFYKRIRQKHLNHINIEREMKIFVKKQTESKKNSLKRNIVISKLTKTFENKSMLEYKYLIISLF